MFISGITIFKILSKLFLLKL